MPQAVVPSLSTFYLLPTTFYLLPSTYPLFTKTAAKVRLEAVNIKRMAKKMHFFLHYDTFWRFNVVILQRLREKVGIITLINLYNMEKKINMTVNVAIILLAVVPIVASFILLTL